MMLDATVAYAISVCGESPTPDHVYIISDGYNYGSSSYITVYPNSADDILNIDIDVDAATQALPPTVASKNTGLTFDVRLYDGQGNLLRQAATKGARVEFNVAGLPNGIYYLYIYDGVSDKPEIQQIVVEH